MFDNLDSSKKNKLAEGLKEVYLKNEEFVFREGDEGEDFYMIEQGEVECLKLEDMGDDEQCFVNVRVLKAGDHFGELALINK